MYRLTAWFTHAGARFSKVSAAWGKLHAQALIRTRGRVGRSWFGAPMLVLVTRGRRSGRVRETPLLFARDGEAYVLIAANAGNDKPPQWWLNLRAAPAADVLVGGKKVGVAWAEVPAGAEYERLFGVIAQAYPPTARSACAAR